MNGFPYLEVNYFTSAAPLKGGVYAGYLEELINEFPPCMVSTAIQTPNPNDAAQDIGLPG